MYFMLPLIFFLCFFIFQYLFCLFKYLQKVYNVNICALVTFLNLEIHCVLFNSYRKVWRVGFFGWCVVVVLVVFCFVFKAI